MASPEDLRILLHDIEEQLETGVTDPVNLLERAAEAIKGMLPRTDARTSTCVICGHTYIINHGRCGCVT